MMINMRDNTEVKDFIDAKIGYISRELESDKEQIHDPILSQQARGRVVRGEWALKVLSEIKEMLI